MSDPKAGTGFRYLVILGIFALLASWAYSAPEVLAKIQRESQYGHGGDKHDFVGTALHRLLKHQKELALSEEQGGKIKTIATDYKKSRIQKKADVKLAELDVQTRIRDEKADLSSIESAMRKSETARTAMRLEGVKALRAAFTVLTPEQKEKWHQLMAEKRASRGKEFNRKGPHTGPGDQPMREG